MQGHCNSRTIKNLPDGKYYWSVQSIDNCFAGSKFAPAQSFIVQSPKTIIITCPKGGEIWETGSCPVITYSSLGNSGHINLDYSTDGGMTWDTIITNAIDNGEWINWTVPNTPSTKCKIRVSDTDGDPSVVSNGFFSILFNQFTEQASISLPGSRSASWGDYDNDGDLDILLAGSAPKIYKNNGDNTFTEQTSIPLAGNNSAGWIDYNNDGNLDIFTVSQSFTNIPK